MQIIILGLFLRILIAIWNGFFGPSMGAEGDALTFHLLAVGQYGNLEEAKFQYGWVYSIFLFYFYAFTIESLFLGSLLSCFIWLISAIYFDKSLRLLEISKSNRNIALLIYALLPSAILFTAVTLREVYQLMFVSISIYAAIKIINDRSTKHWLVLIVSCLGMSILHVGLLAYSLFLVLLTFYFGAGVRKPGLTFEKILFYVPFLIIVGTYGAVSFESISDQGGYNADFSEGIATAVETYQSGHNEARAMYTYKPQIDGLTGLALFIPVSLFQYLFEPMPWRISTLFDIALFFENLLRGFLIFSMIHAYLSFDSREKNKYLLRYILLAYFALEVLWAMGTVNWGSAARHHIPAMGLLILGSLAFKRKKV